MVTTRLTGQAHSVTQPSQRWRFAVECPRADRVYLVTTTERGSTMWVPMAPASPAPDAPAGTPGTWSAELNLASGDYQFRYIVNRGTSMISGDADGLTAEPLRDTALSA